MSTLGLGLKLTLPSGHRARVADNRLALLKPVGGHGKCGHRGLRRMPAFADGEACRRVTRLKLHHQSWEQRPHT